MKSVATFALAQFAAGNLDAVSFFEHLNVSSLPATAGDSNCPNLGDCGLAYQGCCATYEKLFHAPCGCDFTASGSGAVGSSCGHCGVAYMACCQGFAAKGSPCTCDVEPGAPAPPPMTTAATTSASTASTSTVSTSGSSASSTTASSPSTSSSATMV